MNRLDCLDQRECRLMTIKSLPVEDIHWPLMKQSVKGFCPTNGTSCIFCLKTLIWLKDMRLWCIMLKCISTRYRKSFMVPWLRTNNSKSRTCRLDLLEMTSKKDCPCHLHCHKTLGTSNFGFIISQLRRATPDSWNYILIGFLKLKLTREVSPQK